MIEKARQHSVVSLPKPEEPHVTSIETASIAQLPSHESVASPTASSMRSLTGRRSSSGKGPSASDAELTPMPTVPDSEAVEVEGDDSPAHDDDEPQPKSPLLTERRISTASLDNVSLDEEGSADELPKGIHHLRMHICVYT